MTAIAAALVWTPNSGDGPQAERKNGGLEQEHDAEDMHCAIPGITVVLDVIRKLPPKI